MSPTLEKALKILRSVDQKRVATLVGKSTTGTKNELASTLSNALSKGLHSTQALDDGAKEHSGESAPSNRPTRVLSVDMGLRNLAYCVLEVRSDAFVLSRPDLVAPSRATRRHGSPDSGRKKNTAPTLQLPPSLSLPDTLSRTTISTWDRVALVDPSDVSAAGAAKTELFASRNMAGIAYELVTKTFLPLRPDVILLEQQRYRSGGGSAVQEWTLRVNAFEGMLWAVMHTLGAAGHGTSAHPKVMNIDPARVGRFWIDIASGEKEVQRAPEVESRQAKGTMSKSRVEKKVKIELVNRWMQDNTVDFSGQAAMLRDALVRLASGKVSKEKMRWDNWDEATRKAVIGARGVKLDDLADCVLQGMAWAQWQRNSVKVKEWLQGLEEFPG